MREFHIPWHSKLWFDIKMRCEILISKLIPNYDKYIDLFWLYHYGFKPIGIVEGYYFERTFLFESHSEATRAYHICEEVNRRAIGWYHDVDEFAQLVAEDERYNIKDLEIWWLYE